MTGIVSIVFAFIVSVYSGSPVFASAIPMPLPSFKDKVIDMPAPSFDDSSVPIPDISIDEEKEKGRSVSV